MPRKKIYKPDRSYLVFIPRLRNSCNETQLPENMSAPQHQLLDHVPGS